MNMNLYVIFLLNMLMERKMNLFAKYEYKKINFFNHNKLKFQPITQKSVQC